MAGTCLGRVKPVSTLMLPPLMLAAPTACLALTILPIPHTHTHSQSREARTLPDCPAASAFPVQLLAFSPAVPGSATVEATRGQVFLVEIFGRTLYLSTTHSLTTASGLGWMINPQAETWEEPGAGGTFQSLESQ